MRKAILALALAAATYATAQNATPITPVIPLNYNNPISPLYLCADPTAVDYEGRLYVYGTNDQQEYDAVSPGTGNSYGHIRSLVTFSTEDLVNWTHHGTIDMGKVCGGWMGCSWAPSICSRVEDDGQTHFYMYFSNGGGGVGVVTSTSPVGPWTDPLNRTFINGGTPGVSPCSWPFDPGVVVDDEGNGWLAFGGGDPVPGGTKLQPGNACIVKLGPDMLSFASDIIRIPAPYQLEASELNIIGGKFVYSYSSSWTDRNDWASYGSPLPAPSTCSIAYMVSDNPLDPASWEYKGDILRNPGQFGYPGGNNHCHLHKFDDKYYMIYHTQVMEQLAGIGGAYRSLAVNRATVDEVACAISPITANNTGAPVLRDRRINPFARVEAETMWNAAGVEIGSAGASAAAGNVALVNIQPGGWVAVKNANFEEEATTFTALIRGKGAVEIRVGDLYAEPSGVLEFSNSGMREATCTLDTPIKGQKTIYLVFRSATAVTRFDAWHFGTGAPDGISDVSVDRDVTRREYISPSGVVMQTPRPGLNLERTVYTDGTTETVKIMTR